MSEFVVNGDMFGQYVKIPTGYSGELHIYKVVSHFQSNTYCDVPIVAASNPVPHEKSFTGLDSLEHVLNVIHCGIDESKVIRVALKDCEIVKKNNTNADRIRSMTDEELADFLRYTVWESGDNLLSCDYYTNKGKCKDAICVECPCYLDWLKSPNNIRCDSIEQPWYTEYWYMEDLENALEAAGIEVTVENLQKLLTGCKSIFDDKTERNEMLIDKARKLFEEE